MEPVALVTLAILIGLVTFTYVSKAHVSSLPLPPGPSFLKSMKLLFGAAKTGTLHLQAEQWAHEYGDLVMCHVPVRKLVFLNSSNIIRQMYADKSREHATNDRPRTFSGWFAMHNYKDIILGSPDAQGQWAKLRRLFHSSIRFYGDGMEKFESTVQIELRRLVERVQAAPPMTLTSEQSRRGEEWEVDVSDLVSYSLLCVLGVLLTGECPSSDSEVVRIIKEFDHVVNKALNPGIEGVLTVFPFLRHLPGYYGDACRDITRSREALMQTLFYPAKATRTPGEPRGIIDTLLEEQEKEHLDWLTDTNIMCVIMDIVIAGYLTSRETILDLFLFLLHHPDVMHKMQQEVDHAIGERAPRIEDRRNLPYTEAVILETLRHSSFVPLGVPHECREDVVLKDYFIPKGSMLFANTWVSHRDPEAFPDPLNFRPERFLDKDGQLILTSHPLRQNLVAFGAGKRSCPGENFARTRVFLYVTTLLQKFDILPPVTQPLLPLCRESWENGAMLQLKPYHCVLRRRA